MNVKTLCIVVILLGTGLAVHAAETPAEMPATDPAPELALTSGAEENVSSWLAALSGARPAGNLSQCTDFNCNRPKDCFMQGYNELCESGTSHTAAWCFGYPNVSNCEGYCGCL